MEIKIQQISIKSKLYGMQPLPVFKGKLQKNAEKKITEESLKLASSAAAAVGMTYLGIRDKGKSNFTKEKQEEILQRYLSGETIASISKNTRCSYSKIVKLIGSQPNIKELRQKKYINKVYSLFTEEQIADIISRFKKGEIYESIAADYKCNRTIILKVINRQPNYEEIIEEHNICASLFTTNEKHQIIEMYTKGKSAARIAKELGFSVSSVLLLINQQPNLKELKEKSKLNRHFSYAQQRNIIECYFNGEPIMSIVDKFNCSYDALNYFIKHQPNYEELSAIRRANKRRNNLNK